MPSSFTDTVNLVISVFLVQRMPSHFIPGFIICRKIVKL